MLYIMYFNTTCILCPRLGAEVNWADLMAAQGAFGTDFYDWSILRP